MVLRSKPEKREEKDRIRDELLRAALRLGAVHGFASLGLREVAREALIAPTSFYRHFEDMEALGLAIIHEKAEPFLLEWVGGPATPQDVAPEAGASASTWVGALLQAVDAHPELARFIVAERVGASAALRAAMSEVCQTCSQALLNALGIQKHSRGLLDGAELVMLLMLEAAAQLLDTSSSTSARAAVRQRAVQRVESAIGAICNLSRKP